MTVPSAPQLGSVYFEYSRPFICPEKEGLLTDIEKHELCDATDDLLAGEGYLRGIDMDFSKGAVTLTVESYDNPEYEGTMLLDVVATKFFHDKKEYISTLSPSFAARLENTDMKGAKQISDIFYRTFNRYVEQYTNENGDIDSRVENSTIYHLIPGFKEFNRSSYEEVMSLNVLKQAAGEKFREFIEKLPISLLDKKGWKKASPFLQEALHQKTSYVDKLLYLKQVLFLLTFQDVFKDILQTMYHSRIIEKHNLYTSPTRAHDLSEESQRLHRQLNSLKTTLSKLPVNDVAMLIPLACRSSPAELAQDMPFEDGNTIQEGYLARECGRARQADIAIRHVLESSFHVTPKSFSVKEDHLDSDGIQSIERYLMGITGLAISPGLMGRLAMYDHRTIYYKRENWFTIPSVYDNMPVEFLLTAAQHFSAQEDAWIEEKYLAYLIHMIGGVSSCELDGIKSSIKRVCDAINKLPVDCLLKPSNSRGRCDEYIVRNSAMEKLHALYKEAREKIGLLPIRDATSSCAIM